MNSKDLDELKTLLEQATSLLHRLEVQIQSNKAPRSTIGTQTEPTTEYTHIKGWTKEEEDVCCNTADTGTQTKPTTEYTQIKEWTKEEGDVCSNTADTGTQTEPTTELTHTIECIIEEEEDICSNTADIEDTCPRPFIGETKSPKKRTFLHQVTKEHKLNCLRKSLQTNVVMLVEHLPFTESEIYDMLISNGSLTETECDDLKRFGGRKDQVRNLVRIIRKKTYKDIKAFLSCLDQLHPYIATRLKQDYEKYLGEKPELYFKCSFCKMKGSVDVKKLVDQLWSRSLISEELYEDVITETLTNRNALWEQLVGELRYSSQPNEVIQTIRRFLSEHRQSLVPEFTNFVHFKCSCEATSGSLKEERKESLSDFEGSTASPFSTTRSMTNSESRGLTSFEMPDEELPENIHENQFLSPRTVEHDCYSNVFSRQQSKDETRVRSNSFSKKVRLQIPSIFIENRRSSTFN